MKLEKTFSPLEKSRMRLDIKIGQKDVADFYQEILQKYAKTMQIPGFRKGKAPLGVLESKYGPDLREEARDKLINQAVGEAVENEDRFHSPLIYSQPVLNENPEFDPEKDFSFCVEYDVFPKVEFAGIEGFEVEIPDVSVEDEDIQKELEGIRERNALIVDKEDDAPAETGDIATITYAQLDDSGNEIEGRKWSEAVITLGKGLDIYGVGELAVGMKKGETKEAEKAYPEDYEHKFLAGTTTKLRITLDALKKAELPDLDDELAQDVSEKFQTLDDLKNDIRKELEKILENKIASMRNEALIEKIVKANDFEIPLSMILAELEGRWLSFAARLNTTPEKLEKTMANTGRSKEEMYSLWREDSEWRLKSRIAIETLIGQLKIDIAPEDLEKEMEKIAKDSETSIDEIKKRYAEGRQKEYLVDELKERRLFEMLLEKNTVKKGEKQSLGDLLGNI